MDLLIEMMQDKETKGTFRYSSVDPDARITTLYVRKDGTPPPARIVITVAAQS